MSRPTGREQVARMMQMPVGEHATRAADFIQKAQESREAAFAAEEKAMDHAEAADQLTGTARAQQLQLQRAQQKHAAVLRRNEEMFQTTAQNHSNAATRIAAKKGRIYTAAVRHANAHRRANPTGTRTHNELVDFHTSRLSEAAGLAPHSVQHQGKTIRITHKPVAGFIPAHSWLAKTIRKTRTGHPHGTKGGRRKTRRHRRRSKRRRTRKHRTKRRRTRRRHKRRHRRRRRR